MLRWRTAVLEKIFAERTEYVEHAYIKNERSFDLEWASKASFMAFGKVPVNGEQYARLLGVIRVDALVTASIYVLKDAT